MFEDAIVEVSEAPILLRPMTYNNAASREYTENTIRYAQSSIFKCDVEVADIITAKIKPEINNEAPGYLKGAMCFNQLRHKYNSCGESKG